MKDSVIVFDSNPIWHSNDEFELTKEEKLIIKELTNIPNTKGGLSFISESKYIFKNHKLKNIKNYFEEKIQSYIDNILEIKINPQLTHSWVTIQNKGGNHHFHHHNNTFLSLVYYPQVENGNITFAITKSKIERETNLGFELIKPNVFNGTKKTLIVNKNDVVIFPGWLTHGTDFNDNEGDRVSIVANYWIKGELGMDEKVNRLML